MAKRTVTIELDEDRMEAFAEICESMDMSESTAFRIFVHAVVAERGIPFLVKASDDVVAVCHSMEEFRAFVDSL
ncbi:addiction module antitoxin, RelB/DinJ family [Aedoeadaptatus ivorii]|uniref:Addiction module antitoxin, RelB/DinJ family n=1 Tax=Aedoeadaptatus ivorii TaxID=54006 RepID=A0A3S4Y8A3_9FIRM|nr:type II toxin-antitoxin system RelB/DinJ family antitoxin [Peptoniphilus ivorii]VEJ36330.1 addiction module antitoxin, RelB/DinJ family [Peptoniphilus ivorii]